jgi:hypothetical protein
LNTKIVMSFAMAHNGWAFSHWLWERLRRQYGLYELGGVYNDYLVGIDVARGDDVTFERKIDPRPETTSRPIGEIVDAHSEPSRPIGTQRSDWKALFNDALASAAVGLTVLTREFDESGWCGQEAVLFRQQQERRVNEGLPPFKIVVLCLVPHSTDTLRTRFGNAEIVYAAKYSDFNKTRSDDHPERYEPLLWEKEDWKITDDAYAALINAIGPLA